MEFNRTKIESTEEKFKFKTKELATIELEAVYEVQGKENYLKLIELLKDKERNNEEILELLEKKANIISDVTNSPAFDFKIQNMEELKSVD